MNELWIFFLKIKFMFCFSQTLFNLLQWTIFKLFVCFFCYQIEIILRAFIKMFILNQFVDFYVYDSWKRYVNLIFIMKIQAKWKNNEFRNFFFSRSSIFFLNSLHFKLYKLSYNPNSQIDAMYPLHKQRCAK